MMLGSVCQILLFTILEVVVLLKQRLTRNVTKTYILGSLYNYQLLCFIMTFGEMTRCSETNYLNRQISLKKKREFSGWVVFFLFITVCSFDFAANYAL